MQLPGRNQQLLVRAERGGHGRAGEPDMWDFLAVQISRGVPSPEAGPLKDEVSSRSVGECRTVADERAEGCARNRVPRAEFIPQGRGTYQSSPVGREGHAVDRPLVPVEHLVMLAGSPSEAAEKGTTATIVAGDVQPLTIGRERQPRDPAFLLDFTSTDPVTGTPDADGAVMSAGGQVLAVAGEC